VNWRRLFAILAAVALMPMQTSAQNAPPIVSEAGIAGLSGTLLRPVAERPPVVLIIAGSGPTDRDGKGLGVAATYLRQLAEGLAKHGIATLRYDKRGIGQSRSAAIPEDQLRIDHFVSDAETWVTWLRTRGDLGRVIVAGHSEGGLIAILLAHRVNLDGAVLIATSGRPLGSIIRDQLDAAPMPDALRNEANAMLSALKRGESVAAVSAPLQPLFRPSVQPYLRSVMAIDPAKELAALQLPLMIVSGGRDLQIGAADTEALVRAKPDARRFHVSEMNHILTNAPSDRESNLKLYADPRSGLTPGLVDALAAFVSDPAR
jgi:pimeloyl-ACP methyl ester carboxylesterase